MLMGLMSLQGEFVPTDIPSLAAWYDASDLDTIIITSSPLVDQWSDKSGNGRHLTSAGSARPDYSATALEGSLPAISFGASELLDKVAAATPTYTKFDFYAVWQRDTANDSGYHLGFVRYDSREFRCGVYSTNNTWAIEASTNGTGTTNRVEGSAVVQGEKVLFHAYKDTTNLAISIDGGVASTQAMASIHNGTNPIDVGRTTGADFNGSISEILWFTDELSASQRSAVQSYLNKKWALGL